MLKPGRGGISALWQTVTQTLDEALEDLDPSDIEELPEHLKFDGLAYIKERLGWTPWEGPSEDEPGQAEIAIAYNEVIRAQWEKYQLETGKISVEDLEYYTPGVRIQNWIRVQSGNLVGKTKLLSGLFNHFFDAFPSIIYTFAPDSHQVQNLLWKEIRDDRGKNALQGRCLEGEPALKLTPTRFALGRATNDNNNAGIERLQGQHAPYLMFIVDEADGVPQFVFDAIENMDSGVICVVLAVGNPRSMSTPFSRLKSLSYVQSYRIDSRWHPNIINGRSEIQGGPTRDWLMARVEKYCEVVPKHNDDQLTFTLSWTGNIIYRPTAGFYWRVFGLAPADEADDVFCPYGRYEAAQKRAAYEGDPANFASIGIDVARYGKDLGTMYVRFQGEVWKEGEFPQKRTTDYARACKTVIKWLISQGAEIISVRIDGGGGFGGGIVDSLEEDIGIQQAVEYGKKIAKLRIDGIGDTTAPEDGEKPPESQYLGLVEFNVFEVHFQSPPYDEESYADTVTEIYDHACEALKVLRLHEPPGALERDLCQRKFKYGKRKGVDVKKIRSKEEFRKEHKASPDDGDGFCLATAPDYCFDKEWSEPEFLAV